MSWKYTLSILVVINVINVILTKTVTDRMSKKAIGVFYQYLICAGLTILYAVFFKEEDIMSPVILLAGAIGLVNAFGCYFLWRALEVSLSKTTLCFPLFSLGSIILAIIFLKEFKLWNAQLTIGAGLCFLAIWSFKAKKIDKEEKTLTLNWFISVLLMILIFSIAGFLVRVFSFTISRATFMLGWYVGSFFGTLVLLLIKKQKPTKIPKKLILLILTLSLTIVGMQFTLYQTYQLGGSVSLVLPILSVCITLIPALFGLFILKERKGLSKRGWIAFLMGIIGAFLVLFR